MDHRQVAQSLDDVTFAFLDVETTGLSPRYGDRVCEIAVVRSRIDLVQATYATLVNPTRRISPGASAVNGIRDDDVRSAPLFSAIADHVLTLLRDAVIVCHNAPFDLGFVAHELMRAGQVWHPPCVVDTLEIARAAYHFRSNSLSNIAHALGIETPDAHRALGDVLTTRAVLNRFIDDLWKRNLRTLDDLLNVQGGNGILAGAMQSPDVPLPPEISEALANRKRLVLEYLDAKGRRTERVVTPQQISGFGDTLYLVAHCHLRDEVRNFRLDRIVKMKVETN
jgi:DNA polymerase III epsilon subunit family exonuclease